MKLFGKCAIIVAIVALAFSALPASAAKDPALFAKGVEMMIKARDTMREGVNTVEQGMKQYVQICTDKGCLPDVTAGNKIITDGLEKAKQGMALLDQGQQEWKVCVANRNLEGQYRCLDTFVEGGRMVQEGLQAIDKGMKDNNAALRAKGLDKDTSAPSTMVTKGVESGLIGMRAFLEGQRLALANRP